MQFPVLVTQIALELETNGDQERLILTLMKLVSEDLTFLQRKFAIRLNHLAGMSELHLEITIDRITREYSFKIKTTPQLAYRETIREP
ncbi:MAG: hypothetical protein ACTS4V_00065 [Candidatus Hodgkinia cicadicola]